MLALEVRKVSKRFKESGKWFYALKGIDLFVENSEIFGLLGPNGAGKTTLLNMLIGILLPDSGTIHILGKDIVKEREMVKKIGFVPSDARFYWRLKVLDILEFYSRVYGLKGRKREERIKELVEFFGIEDILYRRFESLSTGERMRLIFTKSLLHEPEILLLDEPTLGLDPHIAIKVRKEIKRINKEKGTTILFTSHYMHEVEQLCDRIAFIHKGRVLDIGTAKSIKLRVFETYDVVVKVKRILDKKSLEAQSFRVQGNQIIKSLPYHETPNEILSFLSNQGYEILRIETKEPTLEDYFVKVVGEKNETP